MVTAPVGFQCPECVKGAPPVRRYSELRAATERPPVTSAIVAVNAIVFVLSLGGGGNALGRSFNRLTLDYALNGPAVADGEWYRLVTAGFLHYGLIHVGFNMLILWQLGQLLEPSLGRVRFGLLYLAALLGGSVGALLLSPDAFTAGASGAVFGCMGAAVVALKRRGVGVLQSSIGGLLAVNLLLTFAISGISIGGHLGGLAVGAAAGFVLDRTDRQPQAGAVAVAALALVLFAAGVVVA
jgi:membrane associated rhomboid family serine protease